MLLRINLYSVRSTSCLALPSHLAVLVPADPTATTIDSAALLTCSMFESHNVPGEALSAEQAEAEVERCGAAAPCCHIIMVCLQCCVDALLCWAGVSFQTAHLCRLRKLAPPADEFM